MKWKSEILGYIAVVVLSIIAAFLLLYRSYLTWQQAAHEYQMQSKENKNE